MSAFMVLALSSCDRDYMAGKAETTDHQALLSKELARAALGLDSSLSSRRVALHGAPVCCPPPPFPPARLRPDVRGKWEPPWSLLLGWEPCQAGPPGSVSCPVPATQCLAHSGSSPNIP